MVSWTTSDRDSALRKLINSKDVPLSLERKVDVDQIGGTAGRANLQWQTQAQTTRFLRRELTCVPAAVRPVTAVQIQRHLRTRQTAA